MRAIDLLDWLFINAGPLRLVSRLALYLGFAFVLWKRPLAGLVLCVVALVAERIRTAQAPNPPECPREPLAKEARRSKSTLP